MSRRSSTPSLLALIGFGILFTLTAWAGLLLLGLSKQPP